MLPSALLLTVVAVVALVLARARPVSENQRAWRDAARALTLAVAAQSAHFAEEAATGFHQRFPALLGQSAMPLAVFLLFNVGWLAIWTASVRGLRSGRSGPLFAAWFLAIAGIVNGLAHPLMAIVVGGYFPGLVTSPVIGAAAALLYVTLHRATPPRMST